MSVGYNKKIGGDWELIKSTAAPSGGIAFDITAHFQGVSMANGTSSSTAPVSTLKGGLIPEAGTGTFTLDQGEYLWGRTTNRRGSATLYIVERT